MMEKPKKKYQRNIAGEWLINQLRKQPLEALKEEKREKYMELFLSITMGFQMLESAIKRYIIMVYSLMRINLPDGLLFKYTKKDIEKANLTQALEYFEKLNGNITLHKKIKKLIPKRNHYAHAGLLLYKGTRREKLNQIEWLDKESQECMKIIPLVYALTDQVLREIENLPLPSSK